MSRTPSLLDSVRVASPCTAAWNDMDGDERVRFCSQCKQNVYNLSDMTREQAEDLVRERAGRVCVRFFRRRDGTMLMRDCPVGLAAWRRKLILAFTALAAAIVLALTMVIAGVSQALSLGEPRPGGEARIGLFQRIWDSLFPDPGVPLILPAPANPWRGEVLGKLCIPEKDMPFVPDFPEVPEVLPVPMGPDQGE